MGETAREVADTLEPAVKRSMLDFQNRIARIEHRKLDEIAKAREEHDVVLVDRTIADNRAYGIYNALTGKLDGTLKLQIPPLRSEGYDRIYYFDTPVKNTTTEGFTHYNNDDLQNLMTEFIKLRYLDQVKLYSNAIDDREAILQDVGELV